MEQIHTSLPLFPGREAGHFTGAPSTAMFPGHSLLETGIVLTGSALHGTVFLQAPVPNPSVKESEEFLCPSLPTGMAGHELEAVRQLAHIPSIYM